MVNSFNGDRMACFETKLVLSAIFQPLCPLRSGSVPVRAEPFEHRPWLLLNLVRLSGNVSEQVSYYRNRRSSRSICAIVAKQCHIQHKMTSRIHDRWLWLGLGIFVFFAAKGIRYAITDVVRLTKIDPAQYEPINKNEERPEDST